MRRTYDRSICADLLEQAEQQLKEIGAEHPDADGAVSVLWVQQFAEWADRRFAELYERIEQLEKLQPG